APAEVAGARGRVGAGAPQWWRPCRFMSSLALPAALWALPAVFCTAPLACRPTLPVALPAASFTAPLAWFLAPSTRVVFILRSPRLGSWGGSSDVRPRLHSSDEDEHQHDHQHEAETAARVIAPATAPAPGGQGAEHQQDEDDE